MKTIINTILLLLLLFANHTSRLMAQQQIPDFQVNGAAVQLDNLCYKLTSPQMSQSGSIWCLDQINLDNSFDVTISVHLGCQDIDGADGLVFGFQPVSTSVGSVGGGLGFEGITPSIGIEFDTYTNSNNSDPNFDHVAIIKNGILNHNAASNLAGPVQASSTNPDIEDCEDHLVRVTWNATTHTLTVYFDCVLRLSYTNDIVSSIFNGNGDVFWGFTAATGALFNEQSICLLDASFFEATPDINICLGSTAELSAPSGSNYQWTPTTDLSNPNIQNPTATPTTTTSYVVTFEQGCQTLSDTIVVTVNDVDVTIVGDELVCEGESSQLDAGNFFFYQWSTGATTASINVSQPATYTVTVYGDGGCSDTDSFTLLNALSPSPIITGNTNICEGETTSIGTTESYSSYLWSNGEISQQISVNTSGTYTVTVSNEQACTATTTAIVSLNDQLQPQISGNMTICEGETTSIGTTESYSSYLWSNGETSQQISVNTAGTYTVTVSSTTGCSGSSLAVVEVFDLPLVAITGNLVISESSTTLTATTGFAAYLWSNNATSNAISVQTSGTYAVTVTDSNACTNTASVVVSSSPLFPIVIPNAFSPNNDNVNDQFRVIAKNVNSFHCQIYNRWGQQLFESNDINEAWDGTFKGILQEMGVYAYTITIEQSNGTIDVKKGNVSLLY